MKAIALSEKEKKEALCKWVSLKLQQRIDAWVILLKMNQLWNFKQEQTKKWRWKLRKKQSWLGFGNDSSWLVCAGCCSENVVLFCQMKAA